MNHSDLAVGKAKDTPPTFAVDFGIVYYCCGHFLAIPSQTCLRILEGLSVRSVTRPTYSHAKCETTLYLGISYYLILTSMCLYVQIVDMYMHMNMYMSISMCAWLCMIMYDYVWFCMIMHGDVWLCVMMYDYVCMIITFSKETWTYHKRCNSNDNRGNDQNWWIWTIQ